MKCSTCKRDGHTARNCPGLPGGVPTAEMWAHVEAKSEARAMRGRCGNCGGKGHNLRTCPQLQKQR
jgi:hypothetical protein